MRVIDVSHHQNIIDWTKVRQENEPSLGVIIRAGFGRGNIDKQFYNNIRGAILNNFDYIGLYWFSYAYTTDMALQEAEFLNSLLNDTVKSKLKLGVYFDWEYDSMKYAKANGVIPNPKLITDMTIIWCERMTQLGCIAGYYINEDYTKQKLFDLDRLIKYRKWYARYSSKAKPVNSYLHQYTSKGSIKGINGNVDISKIVSPSTVYEVALEVIDGKWGNGFTRKLKLELANYDYKSVQRVVNNILRG
jgi:GH25 family lysozyme M1 (1,4-beta-N-acetylmuramidase)